MIMAWWEDVAASCESRKDATVRCAEQGGAHATLRTVLLAHDIPVTAPLSAIYKQIIDKKIQDNEPVLGIFCKQWDQYVQKVYAVNYEEAQKRSVVDREWFVKRRDAITFQTVLSNELWKKLPLHDRNESEFDTFHERSSAQRRSGKQLLSKRNRLDELTDLDQKLSCAEVVMNHVAARRIRAKANVYNKRLTEWFRASFDPLARLITGPFVLANHEHPLGEPLKYRESIAKLVTTYIEEVVNKPPEELKAVMEIVKGGAQTLKDDCERELKQKKAQFAESFRTHVWQILLTNWCDQLLQCWQGWIKIPGVMDPVRGILDDWPTTEEEEGERPHKRARVGERKAENTTSRVTEILATVPEDLADTDAFMNDYLSRVCAVVEADNAQTKNAIKPVKDELMALLLLTVKIDYAGFLLELAERASLNPYLLQGGAEARAAVMGLAKHDASMQLDNEYGTVMVAAEVARAEPYHKAYLKLHELVVSRWKETVQRPLEAKRQQLSTFINDALSRPMAYEPWLEAPLTSSQRAKLREILPLKEEPVTIANALMQCTKWFEHCMNK